MRNSSGLAGRYAGEITAAVRADLLIYATTLIYLACGAVYVLAAQRTIFPEYGVYSVGCVVLCCVVLPYIVLTLGVVRVIFLSKARRSLAWRTLVAPRRIGRLVAGTLLILAMLMFFEAMYTSVKTTFSAVDFPYDKLVADVDNALHFGRAPAHWLSFLRFGWLLRAVETNYDGVWFVFWLSTLYWFCVSPRAEALRVRFVLTFMLTWVLVGNLVAGVVLTAGPALYGAATGDHDRFAGLAAFLGSTPNATNATQHYLWLLHEAGTGGLGSGISAFPSMHVAVTVVCALFLSEMDKRLGIAAWCFVGIIVLSSVYLGWHYAVDGYTSIILTSAIYWAVRHAPELLKLRFRFRRPTALGIDASADTASP